MRKFPLFVFFVGLSFGIGAGAWQGVSTWLDWINEPLRQPRSLQLGTVARPPLVGAQAGQEPASPTSVPPTLAAPTVLTTTSRSTPLALPSTPQRPVIPASAPTAAAPPAPISVTPAVAPLTTGSQHRVTNTEGQGVALRASPGADRLPGKGYDDGDVLTVLEQQGEWTHIRGADGRDGWVLTVTLGS